MAVLVDAITTILALWAVYLLSKIDIVSLRVGYLKILMAIAIVSHSSLIHARLSGHSELIEVFSSVNEFLAISFGLMIISTIKKLSHDPKN